ncbi:hypothetical protein N7528_005278 [Penicillium herquei]|nr:hypothetical protein N7528_005278 [Penicillium herquei]
MKLTAVLISAGIFWDAALAGSQGTSTTKTQTGTTVTASSTLQASSDGVCYTYTFQGGDTCQKIATAYGLTVALIEEYNADTWEWPGCSSPDLYQGYFLCLGPGDPPMPVALPEATCGPQVPGTTRPGNYSDLSSLNPCKDDEYATNKDQSTQSTYATQSTRKAESITTKTTTTQKTETTSKPITKEADSTSEAQYTHKTQSTSSYNTESMTNKITTTQKTETTIHDYRFHVYRTHDFCHTPNPIYSAFNICNDNKHKPYQNLRGAYNRSHAHIHNYVHNHNRNWQAGDLNQTRNQNQASDNTNDRVHHKRPDVNLNQYGDMGHEYLRWLEVQRDSFRATRQHISKFKMSCPAWWPQRGDFGN